MLLVILSTSFDPLDPMIITYQATLLGNEHMSDCITVSEKDMFGGS